MRGFFKGLAVLCAAPCLMLGSVPAASAAPGASGAATAVGTYGGGPGSCDARGNEVSGWGIAAPVAFTIFGHTYLGFGSMRFRIGCGGRFPDLLLEVIPGVQTVGFATVGLTCETEGDPALAQGTVTASTVAITTPVTCWDWITGSEGDATLSMTATLNQTGTAGPWETLLGALPAGSGGTVADVVSRQTGVENPAGVAVQTFTLS